MIWLVYYWPYWLCISCSKRPNYKPGDMCDQRKHAVYYAKLLKAKRQAWRNRRNET